MISGQKKWDYNVTNFTKIHRAFTACMDTPDWSDGFKDGSVMIIHTMSAPNTTITLSAFTDLKLIIITSLTDNINTANNFVSMCNAFERSLNSQP